MHIIPSAPAKDQKAVVNIALILSVILNLAFAYAFLQNKDGKAQPNISANGCPGCNGEPNNDQQAKPSNFTLLSPYIAQMAPDDFLEKQEYFRASYYGLKQRINDTLVKENITAGIYFEDLNSGAWVGINEREKFIPSSLMKIPVAAAIIKKTERNELNLSDPVTILPDDLDYKYGNLAEKGYGYNMTIIQLTNYMFYHSDNTALRALFRQIDDNDNIDAWMNLGIPYGKVVPYLNGTNQTLFVSPKDYSNILRTLYYSGYLKRRSSQLLLLLLSKTSFKDGLPAGVPENVTVAHKIGAYELEGTFYHHDCGIIYTPHEPYILCVMTKGMPPEESNVFIRRISRIAYDYVTGDEGNNPKKQENQKANETERRTTGSGIEDWITGLAYTLSRSRENLTSTIQQ